MQGVFSYEGKGKTLPSKLVLIDSSMINLCLRCLPFVCVCLCVCVWCACVCGVRMCGVHVCVLVCYNIKRFCLKVVNSMNIEREI